MRRLLISSILVVAALNSTPNSETMSSYWAGHEMFLAAVILLWAEGTATEWHWSGDDVLETLADYGIKPETPAFAQEFADEWWYNFLNHAKEHGMTNPREIANAENFASFNWFFSHAERPISREQMNMRATQPEHEAGYDTPDDTTVDSNDSHYDDPNYDRMDEEDEDEDSIASNDSDWSYQTATMETDEEDDDTDDDEEEPEQEYRARRALEILHDEYDKRVRRN